MAGIFDNQSPRYFAAHYRKEGIINQEDVLEKFIWFLEDEDTGFTPKQTKQIKAAVDQFLNRDMEKICQGENEMLKAWIKAATGQN